MLIDALSASSSIIKRALSAILLLIVCVCSQICKRFNTATFFLTTSNNGCGVLKFIPNVWAAVLVKSPFSALVVIEFAMAVEKPGMRPTPILFFWLLAYTLSN